jgi:HemY protein
MIRLLIFFVVVIVIATGATMLLAMDGSITASIAGWRFDLPIGAAAGLLLVFTALVAGLVSLLKDLMRVPGSARRRARERRREKGVAALTKGFEAIAEGDAEAARRHAAAATKTLEEATVAKLLAAQAAEASGDEIALGEALAGLLETPGAEFIARRGLFEKARRDGDNDAARRYAEEAFAAQPRARWAFEAVFALALERADWRAARDLVRKATKAKSIDPERARRAGAALGAAIAQELAASDDGEAARIEAEAALKLAPGFAPAAVIAARAEAARGNAARAQKILGAAFAAAPERALGQTLLALTEHDDRALRAGAVARLAEANPPARVAALLRAEAHLIAGDTAAAERELAAPLAESLTAEAALLMADAARALRGAAAGGVWLARAAPAANEPGMNADDFARLGPDGWRRLIVEYIDHERLEPPPIAPAPIGYAESAVMAAPSDPTPAEVEAPATDELLARDAAAARGVN